MSEVHRYKVVSMLSMAGNRIKYDPHGPTVVMAEAYDAAQSELAALREELAALSAPGPLCFCGLKKTKNPHPEAGVPPGYLEVGTVYDCIPCLNKSRRAWSKKANRLQSELTASEQRNAKLLQICRDIQPLITAEPLGVLSGMADQSKRLDWYDKLRPVRERLDAALNPAESGASE